MVCGKKTATRQTAAAIDFDDNIGDWKLLRLQQHLPLHKTIQTAIPNHSRSYEKAVEGEVRGDVLLMEG